MRLVASIVISLAFVVIGELLRPKTSPPDAKAASIDDFDFPTASETRNWSWLAGKCLVEGGNVSWYGDLRSTPVKKKVKTGLWSSKRVTIANRYNLGIEMFLSIGPVDDVSEVRFGGEVPNIFTKSTTADTIVYTFNDPDFFGGDEKDGGVVGTLRIHKGTQTQTANSYLQTAIGRARSAYRGLCFAAFEGMYIGTRESLRPVSFVVERYPNTLGMTGGMHRIDDDANAMCMIYELLTDQRWGAAIPSTEIDVNNFRDIGAKLHAEGMGLSMLINTSRTASDAVAEILRHIDGVMYTDTETGLLTVAIARDDYDVETLPVFGPSEVSSFQYSRGSWATTKNTLMVNFIDREQDFSARSLPLRENGNIHVRNGEIAEESVDYFGFSKPQNALKRGMVTLKTISYPLLTGKIVMNGKGWKLRPGSVFKLNWPAEGMSNLVLRVTRINYGDIVRNRIELDCVEDIFAIASTAYVVPPPTNWTNPLGPPQALSAQHSFELPYAFLQNGSRYVGVLGNPFSGIDQGYEVWHDPTGGTNYVFSQSVTEFTPTGVLASAYSKNTAALDNTGFLVASPRNLDQLMTATNDEFNAGESVLLITSEAGSELCAWRTPVNNYNGTYTITGIQRGAYDTVPLDHPAGARVWFITNGLDVASETPYGNVATQRFRLLPFNARGKLALADATTITLSMFGRSARPHPPGKIRFSDAYTAATLYPGVTMKGTVTISWEHRNRLTQLVPVSIDATGVDPELNTTYAIRIYNADTNALIVQKTAINAKTASFTLASAVNVRVEISSAVDALESFAAWKIPFSYDPDGAVVTEITANVAEDIYVLDGGGP